MGTSLRKCVPDTFGKSASVWGVSAKKKKHSCPQSSWKDWGTVIFAFCLTQYSEVQPASSALFCLKELKRSCLEDTANQPPNSKFKITLTHIFPSCICMFCTEVPGEVDKWETHTHTHTHTSGFEQSRCGIFKRIFQEATTRNSNRGTMMAKCMGVVEVPEITKWTRTLQCPVETI